MGWIIFPLVAISSGPVGAADYVVSNANPNGPGSLRDAIDQANVAPGPNSIDVSVSGPITLISPLPVLESVTISSLGPSGLIIDGSGVSIGSGADAAFDTADTIAISDVSGGGSLTKQGLGTLALGGISNYLGGTTVTAGTLQGNTSTLKGNISNSGNVVFVQPTDDTFAGTIIGGGSLTKQGAGVLTLTGPNSYTGGTIVTAGTLQGNTTTLKGNIANGAGATIVFNQTTAGTYTGIISGSGSVTKQGTETLTLSNTNTYTGSTDVDQGTLIVNGTTGAVSVQSGAKLAGSGVVGPTTVSGEVAPGNSIGTLTVTDNFTQNAGSTYTVEMDGLGNVAGTNNDLINVTGTPGDATINGGTVDVQAAPGTYTPGTTYTILTAAGSVGGTYASITDTLALRDFVLVYNTNSVQMMVQRTPGDFATNAMTQNQFSVGTSLDSINSTAVGDMGVVLDEMLVLTPSEQASAMGQMSGELHGTMATLGLQSSSHMVQLLSRSLASARRPRLRIAQAIDAYSSSDDAPIALVSYTRSTREVPPQKRCCGYQGWNGWVLGYGLGGNAEGDGNASGSEYSMGGTLFGIQRWLNTQTMIGMYAGYGHSDVDTASSDQSARVDSAKLGGYLRHMDHRGYWLATGGFGYDDYDSARRVSFGGIDRVASADYSGQQAIAYLERGIVKCWGEHRVTPLAALQYIYLHQNDFTETGAGALNLSVDDSHTHSLRSMLGIDITRPCGTIWRHRVDPRFRAAWMHEFLDTNGVSQARFNSAGSPAMNIQGLDLGRDWAVVGYGIDLQSRRHAKLFLGYDVQFNSHQTFHVGSGGLQLNW